nr:MAG TPA: hypothetical protein [Bacteriophage sp.]
MLERQLKLSVPMLKQDVWKQKRYVPQTKLHVSQQRSREQRPSPNFQKTLMPLSARRTAQQVPQTRLPTKQMQRRASAPKPKISVPKQKLHASRMKTRDWRLKPSVPTTKQREKLRKLHGRTQKRSV